MTASATELRALMRKEGEGSEVREDDHMLFPLFQWGPNNITPDQATAYLKYTLFGGDTNEAKKAVDTEKRLYAGLTSQILGVYPGAVVNYYNPLGIYGEGKPAPSPRKGTLHDERLLDLMVRAFYDHPYSQERPLVFTINQVDGYEPADEQRIKPPRLSSYQCAVVPYPEGDQNLFTGVVKPGVNLNTYYKLTDETANPLLDLLERYFEKTEPLTDWIRNTPPLNPEVATAASLADAIIPSSTWVAPDSRPSIRFFRMPPLQGLSSRYIGGLLQGIMGSQLLDRILDDIILWNYNELVELFFGFLELGNNIIPGEIKPSDLKYLIRTFLTFGRGFLIAAYTPSTSRVHAYILGCFYETINSVGLTRTSDLYILHQAGNDWASRKTLFQTALQALFSPHKGKQGESPLLDLFPMKIRPIYQTHRTFGFISKLFFKDNTPEGSSTFTPTSTLPITTSSHTSIYTYTKRNSYYRVVNILPASELLKSSHDSDTLYVVFTADNKESMAGLVTTTADIPGTSSRRNSLLSKATALVTGKAQPEPLFIVPLGDWFESKYSLWIEAKDQSPLVDLKDLLLDQILVAEAPTGALDIHLLTLVCHALQRSSTSDIATSLQSGIEESVSSHVYSICTRNLQQRSRSFYSLLGDTQVQPFGTFYRRLRWNRDPEPNIKESTNTNRLLDGIGLLLITTPLALTYCSMVGMTEFYRLRGEKRQAIDLFWEMIKENPLGKQQLLPGVENGFTVGDIFTNALTFSRLKDYHICWYFYRRYKRGDSIQVDLVDGVLALHNQFVRELNLLLSPPSISQEVHKAVVIQRTSWAVWTAGLLLSMLNTLSQTDTYAEAMDLESAEPLPFKDRNLASLMNFFNQEGHPFKGAAFKDWEEIHRAFSVPRNRPEEYNGAFSTFLSSWVLSPNRLTDKSEVPLTRSVLFLKLRTLLEVLILQLDLELVWGSPRPDSKKLKDLKYDSFQPAKADSVSAPLTPLNHGPYFLLDTIELEQIVTAYGLSKQFIDYIFFGLVNAKSHPEYRRVSVPEKGIIFDNNNQTLLQQPSNKPLEYLQISKQLPFMHTRPSNWTEMYAYWLYQYGGYDSLPSSFISYGEEYKCPRFRAIPYFVTSRKEDDDTIYWNGQNMHGPQITVRDGLEFLFYLFFVEAENLLFSKPNAPSPKGLISLSLSNLLSDSLIYDPLFQLIGNDGRDLFYNKVSTLSVRRLRVLMPTLMGYLLTHYIGHTAKFQLYSYTDSQTNRQLRLDNLNSQAKIDANLINDWFVKGNGKRTGNILDTTTLLHPVYPLVSPDLDNPDTTLGDIWVMYNMEPIDVDLNDKDFMELVKENPATPKVTSQVYGDQGSFLVEEYTLASLNRIHARLSSGEPFYDPPGQLGASIEGLLHLLSQHRETRWRCNLTKLNGYDQSVINSAKLQYDQQTTQMVNMYRTKFSK